MGVKWNSPEFWNAVKGDYAAVDANGYTYSYDREPTLGGLAWFGGVNHHSMVRLAVSGVPRAEDWRESLISRPVDGGTQPPNRVREIYGVRIQQGGMVSESSEEVSVPEGVADGYRLGALLGDALERSGCPRPYQVIAVALSYLMAAHGVSEISDDGTETREMCEAAERVARAYEEHDASLGWR